MAARGGHHAIEVDYLGLVPRRDEQESLVDRDRSEARERWREVRCGVQLEQLVERALVQTVRDERRGALARRHEDRAVARDRHPGDRRRRALAELARCEHGHRRRFESERRRSVEPEDRLEIPQLEDRGAVEGGGDELRAVVEEDDRRDRPRRHHLHQGRHLGRDRGRARAGAARRRDRDRFVHAAGGHQRVVRRDGDRDDGLLQLERPLRDPVPRLVARRVRLRRGRRRRGRRRVVLAHRDLRYAGGDVAHRNFPAAGGATGSSGGCG
mmetsp:Transcript_86503/g.259530  ORF Transcript_86503/g.259530 Transcript_86503/m.259530 type:complete len:269 (+) Transcript_86503:1381-2187(+)